MHRPNSPVSRSARSIVLLSALLAGASSVGCHAVSGNVNNEVGQTMYREGNYAAARQAFHRATLDDPMNSDYWHNLAAASRRQGDVAGAEKLYRHAINVDPMHQPTYHSLAQLLRDNGREGEAYNVLAGWADSQPYNAQSHVELAWIQRETGNLDGAEQSLRQALQVSPNHPTALAHLGQVYEERGNPQMASSIYRRSLAQNWNQPKVHSRLASLPNRTRTVGGAPMLAAQPMYAASPTQWGAGPLVASPQLVGPTATAPPQPTFAVGTAGSTTRVVAAPPNGHRFDTPALLGPPMTAPHESPAMIGPPLRVPYASPAEQPVQLGTPSMPRDQSLSSADPAHTSPHQFVPTMTSVPSVEAF